MRTLSSRKGCDHIHIKPSRPQTKGDCLHADDMTHVEKCLRKSKERLEMINEPNKVAGYEINKQIIFFYTTSMSK